MRLIDTDALHHELVVEMVKCVRMNEETKLTMAERVLNKVDEQPTIDAEPVRHGRWISLTECANAGVYCSVCYKKVYKEDYAWCNKKNKVRSPYCPNCGAKMEVDNG